MRLGISIHVFAVAICVALSLADRRLLVSTAFSTAAMPFFGPLLFFAMSAWVVCPLSTIVAATCDKYTVCQKTAAILAEGALSVAQLFALLPACM